MYMQPSQSIQCPLFLPVNTCQDSNPNDRFLRSEPKSFPKTGVHD